MWKKVVAMIVTIAMLATMFVFNFTSTAAVTSADFESSALIDIQYFNGSMQDVKGNAKLVSTGVFTEKYADEATMASFNTSYKAFDFGTSGSKSGTALQYHSDLTTDGTFAVELYGVFRWNGGYHLFADSLVSLYRPNNYNYTSASRPYMRIYPSGAENYLRGENTYINADYPEVYWGSAQHLLIVGNGTSVSYYVNGELVKTRSLGDYSFTPQTIGDFYIGSNESTSYGDKVIRFRYFDDVPTAEEVAALYSSYEEPDIKDDNLIFNVDFTTGSKIDTAGNVTPSESGSIGMVTDTTINKTVATTNGSGLSYAVSSDTLSKLTSDYTLELYAKIDTGYNNSLGTAFGTQHYSTNDGVGFYVNNITSGTNSWGVADTIAVFDGNKPYLTKTQLTGTGKGAWTHYVYVHSGDTGTLYINGEEYASARVADNTTHTAGYGINIGAMDDDGNWSATASYAFARAYSNSATPDDVSEMYHTAINGDVVVDIDFTSGSVADKTGNYSTTDKATLVAAKDMKQYDVYDNAMALSDGSLKYTGNVSIGSKFTFEYYGVFENTKDTRELLTGQYKLETAGGLITAWDNDLSGYAVQGTCADLSKAHHIVIVGDGDRMNLYVDGIKISSGYAPLTSKKISSLSGNFTLRATHLMKFKVYSHSLSEDQVQAAYRATLPSLAFSGASLTLTNRIEVNYKVPSVLFRANSAGYSTPSVTFTYNNNTYTVKDYTVEGNNYVFDFTEVAPDEMNETIKATLNTTLDGVAKTATAQDYSVVQYCKNQLAANTTKTEFTTLLVDMLNYGAAAQIQEKNNTGNLANSWLTDTQKSWATKEDRTLVNSKKTLTDIAESVKWRSVGLNLTDAVDMRFKIATDSLSGLTAKVTVGGKTTEISSFTANPLVAGEYYFFFDGLDASQMSEAVTVTMYRDNVAVSDTIQYSVESYAYALQNDANYGNLVKAMMRYGDATAAYAA